ncbi:MAG: hypothetical protein ACE5HI_14660 [bacterium]
MQQEDVKIIYIAGVSVAFLVFAIGYGISYVHKKNSGSLRTLDQDIAAISYAEQKVWYLKLCGFMHHFGRRDAFSFVAFCIMLFGNITLFYWGLISSVILMSFCISISATFLLSKTKNKKT